LIKNPDFTTKEDKRNYAIALSGFSNSSGGIIVWGILAKKSNQGIDCAIELKAIRGITLLISNGTLTEFLKKCEFTLTAYKKTVKLNHCN
jgi:hypothetical protein